MTLHQMLKTPSEMLAEAIPYAASAVAAADRESVLSDFQAAQVALNALKRASARFDPTVNDWLPFAIAVMEADLRSAISRGAVTHPVEDLAALVFETVNS
jgi:hypothetical protein